MTRAQEIAKEMRAQNTWNDELCRELCELADMSSEWNEADGESFENVIYEAAEKLNVEVI